MSVVVAVARRTAVMVLVCGAMSRLAVAQSWTAVDHPIGRSGSPQPRGIQKYSFARSDLQVTAAGATIRPAFALGSWVAFEPVGGPSQVMAMGDMVLLGSEIAPVMSKLRGPR